MNMKRFLLSLVVVVAAICGNAQPKKTIIAVAVAPEHADWQYSCGEDVKFGLSVFKAGLPLENAEVYYEISEDMQTPLKKGNMTLKDGTAQIKAGTMKKPGFLRLRVWATYEGVRYYGVATAGFDIDRIEPTTTVPEDFDAFWTKVLADNDKLEMLPQLELVPEKCTPKVNVYSASFQNHRKGCRMYGTMCVPADLKPGDKLPAILIVPGAGCRARTGFYAEAEKGFVTLEVGIHHIPTVMDDEIYAQLKAGMMAEYQFYNMDDKDKYVYKSIYAGCARAVDFLAGLDFVDPDRIGVTGGSQGGALSITTAALNPKVKCLAAFYPALADLTGYLYGRGGGWPHAFRNGYMATKERIETSRYYDVANFARKITVPVFYSYGFNDMTCCPTSTTAAYNVIPSSEKTLWIVPEIEHWTYPEQNIARSQWLMDQLKK
jgi:cephalosporin-C deacetylase-like acetyl esterase